MKQRVFIFILLLAIISCNTSKKDKEALNENGIFYPEVEQRSVIIGQIVNINEVFNAPNEIQLAVDDITIDSQHLFKTKVDNNGNFKFDIPLYHSVNTYLIYGDGTLKPFLFPNDTLRLKCKIDRKMFRIGITESKFDDKHHKFQGKFFEVNRWIHYEKLRPFIDGLSKDLTPQEKKEKLLSFENDVLEEIKRKVKQDSLNDLLHKYLIYSLKYEIYTKIIKTGSREIRDFKERKKFFEFISDSICFNSKALITSDYQSFLNFYRHDAELGKTWRIDTIGKTKKQIIYDAINAKFDTIMSMRKGVWSEILASNYIFSEINNREEVLDKFVVDTYIEYAQQHFKDPYIRQMSIALCNSGNDKIKEIQSLTIPKEAHLYPQNEKLSGKDIYEKILSENKGKVIFIDIWGTWCAPCKQKISYAVKANEIFKNKDVEFVYLCCRSNKKHWKKVIKQYQIKGAHYLLSDKQYTFFKKKFSVKGIPHIIFINKNGEIANPNAPNPKSEKLPPMIDSLLNVK